jgi:hypothetical protein
VVAGPEDQFIRLRDHRQFFGFFIDFLKNDVRIEWLSNSVPFPYFATRSTVLKTLQYVWHQDIGYYQNGSRLGILGSDPASPGGLLEDTHVFMIYFQDRRAEVVKV